MQHILTNSTPGLITSPDAHKCKQPSMEERKLHIVVAAATDTTSTNNKHCYSFNRKLYI